MSESPIQRVVGIDLGSNSLKLAIAAVRSDRLPEITIRKRITLRLATDAFDRGRLRDETFESLIEACRRFSEILDQVKVAAYRAVGTEAFRKMVNADEVIRGIGEGSGLTVELLTPESEARLVLDAIRNLIVGGREPDLLVELGGGSLEICAPAGEEETGLRFETHSLGLAARFETFLESRPSGRDTRLELRLRAAKLASELESDLLDSTAPETIVLSGGQAAMLDSLAVKWGLWSDDSSTLDGITPVEFNTLCERMVREETDVIASLGVPPDRAPMLAGAAAFYHALAVRAGAARILVPRAGLMDGLLLTVSEQGRAWPPGRESRG